MRHPSIRARLLLSLLPLFILAEAVIGTVSYRYVLRESHELFDYHLRQMALSLRDQGAVLPPPGPPEDREQFDFVVQIWSADGSKIYLSHTRSRARLPERATLGFADVVTDGERWRVYSTLAGGRVIQVGQPFEVRERIAASAALRSLTPLLIFAPLVALAIWWLVGQSLRPVERIASELRRRDAQRLDPVPAEQLPTEVEPMVRSLNGLLERLRRAFAAQRAFVADAAHELRTPIAALKLQAGLVARARDDAARSAALGELNAGIDRSAHLIDQLLTLARSEPGALASAGVDVDLARVAGDAVAGMLPLAQARGSRIGFTATRPAAIRGDEKALHSLVGNLIDNALRHTPDGSRIEVEVAAESDAVRLSVDDDGPGIPVEERERVFDRFYGRNAGDAAGSGLGLAIVKAVVERHEGRIELGRSALGGLRVAVHLPHPADAT
ncbi:MAG: HAMP domain-containing protein [Burkholderiaceae bacterium]|nr:HAMP domain-containing protein [Burkholderiaceae bacterium]MEB2350070.1 ATP-binding protein [Burkholderiaceae bacterium]